MEDEKILELYWHRDEDAIAQTDRTYGRRLQALANRITQDPEDARECVSDTYLAAWNTIPPKRPQYLFAYLSRICRNFAFGILDYKGAGKRCGEILPLTQELEGCIPDKRFEDCRSAEELGRIISDFLRAESKESRLIFLRRYYYADSVKSIAVRYGISESKVKTRLHRCREKLRKYLMKEGIRV